MRNERVSRCLILAPYPFRHPHHGGQVRTAGIAHGLTDAGWQVSSCSIYPEVAFPPDQRGHEDIVLKDGQLQATVLNDLLFADLITARHAARDADSVGRLCRIIQRRRPDVIHLEQPWAWLLLREALKTITVKPAIVYSSQNIEWRMRPAMYRLGLRRPGADTLVAEIRELELEICHRADLVISISDSEATEISRESGREVIYVPPTSDIADKPPVFRGPLAQKAAAWGIRYAGLLSSAYWPNVEGFLEIFREGLGFLSMDEQIWVGGGLGAALTADLRYQDFKTLNDTRIRPIGWISGAEKADFLGAAQCVIVPVLMGAGAKLKTADAMASGRAVISTSNGVEGYGPLVSAALGCGVYVADDPAEFRRLILRALREGLPGCHETIRAKLRQQRLTETIGPLFEALQSNHSAGESRTVL